MIYPRDVTRERLIHLHGTSIPVYIGVRFFSMISRFHDMTSVAGFVLNTVETGHSLTIHGLEQIAITCLEPCVITRLTQLLSQSLGTIA